MRQALPTPKLCALVREVNVSAFILSYSLQTTMITLKIVYHIHQRYVQRTDDGKKWVSKATQPLHDFRRISMFYTPRDVFVSLQTPSVVHFSAK